MSHPSLTEIRREVERLASVIEAPASALPTYGYSEDGARPHIEVSDALLDYVVVERGEERLRETFADLPSLLERIFRSVASEMAGDYECRHRRAGEDFRRQMFAKGLKYLATLDPEWAARERH